MLDPEVLIYCNSWCPDCRTARRFFRERGIVFRELDVDKDPLAEAAMRAANSDSGKVPTIVCGDTVLVEPTIWELEEAFSGYGPNR